MNINDTSSTHDERRLVIKRVILANPERIFDAWTQPQLLTQWWGPKNVTCPSAEIDLRVGGRYRIANQMSDGSTVWITGIFEEIDRPKKLAYSWSTSLQRQACERVSIFLEPQEDATQITIVHENIPTQQLVISHNAGWDGCLNGLASFIHH